MVTLRRIVLAGLLAAVASGTPAQAETLTCQISASGSFTPGMMLVGGSGLYAFQSPSGLVNSTTCSYDGGPRVPSSIASKGGFTTWFCGYATLDSPAAGATTIDVGMDGSPEVTSLRYRADLRGWTGAVEATRVNGLPETGDVDGVLALRPQHSCTGEPLRGYTVDGLIALEW